MVFRSFDRKLFAKLETTEGQPIATSATDYIETIAPTFSVTNRVYDRDPTRMSITPAPKTVTGTGSGSGLPSASVEISFGVELAGVGREEASGETFASIPRWGRLLKACGMDQVDDVHAVNKLQTAGLAPASGTSAPEPYIIRHREQVAFGDKTGNDEVTSFAAAGPGSGSAVATKFGRAFGTGFYKETEFFWSPCGTSTDPAADDRIYGEITSDWAGTSAGESPCYTVRSTGAGPAAQRVGPGWAPTSGDALGGSNSTSLTLDLYLSDTDQYIQATGCRGNVEFVFTSGDRVLMNFTFTGKLEKYDDSGTAATATGEEIQAPPGCTDFDLTIYNYGYASDAAVRGNEDPYTSTIFNAMTLNLGNEVTIRENMSDSTGYDAAYITGRSTSLTFNPDAVAVGGTYANSPGAFWDRFFGGYTLSMLWTIGAKTADQAAAGTGDGNSFLFRVPAMQFDGIADGNRDEVMVLDSTTALTGGDMGESCQQSITSTTTTAASNVAINPRIGTDNEFTLVLF